MERNATLFDLFWENSKLGPRTVQTFRRRLEEYAATDHEPWQLIYPGADVPLQRATDGLARLFDKRRSARTFSSVALPVRRLGRLLSAFAAGSSASRGFPSAGGLYPLEIFCLLKNVSGGPGRTAVHYNPDNHTLSVVGPLPENHADALNLDGFEGVPQLVVAFVLFPDRMTEKYGERGGRFALIEVGHAAQNLALRLVRERLIGCEIGGFLDEEIIRILSLEGTGAQVALGYACGIAPKRSPVRARLAPRKRARTRSPFEELAKFPPLAGVRTLFH